MQSQRKKTDTSHCGIIRDSRARACKIVCRPCFKKLFETHLFFPKSPQLLRIFLSPMQKKERKDYVAPFDLQLKHAQWTQKKKWFAFEFLGKDSDININTEEPEFSEWAWKSRDNLLSSIVPFKLDVYQRVFLELGLFVK